MKSLLVIYKKTVYEEFYHRDSFRKLVQSGHKAVKGVVHSHDTHNRALENVCEFLEKSGVSPTLLPESKPGWVYQKINRAELTEPPRADLFITVGGDGTFLEAARYLKDEPLLGINSAPVSSVGWFCSVHGSNFKKKLGRVLEEKAKIRLRYERLALTVNDAAHPYPVLNDILMADESPAALSRYYLRFGGKEEFQRGSGVWISTPAGSHAAMKSAGGKKLKRDGDIFQYLVREPYVVEKKWELLYGQFSGRQKLTLVSAMENGCLFLDGAIEKIPFPTGSRVAIGRHPWPLNSY